MRITDFWKRRASLGEAYDFALDEALNYAFMASTAVLDADLAELARSEAGLMAHIAVELALAHKVADPARRRSVSAVSERKFTAWCDDLTAEERVVALEEYRDRRAFYQRELRSGRSWKDVLDEIGFAFGRCCGKPEGSLIEDQETFLMWGPVCGVGRGVANKAGIAVARFLRRHRLVANGRERRQR